MASLKEHIVFDLDDTLWDYQRNSREVLSELYHTYGLGKKGVEQNHFLDTFRRVNNKLWVQFDKGLIDRNIIRKERFPTIFNQLSLNPDGVALQMQDEFMKICPTKPNLVEGAIEVLEYLYSNYRLHIITNGFDEIQFVKIAAAGIKRFFDKVITSGRVGYRKPQPEIFNYALKEIKATPEECVMVGDNPISDIEGAYRHGIDQVYFNTHSIECSIVPTHTIYNLKELIKIY